MYFLTVDQRGSRSRKDAVPEAFRLIRDELSWPRQPLRGPERTAGDEFQLLVDTPRDALWACLILTRNNVWSVGCGIGDVDRPIPADLREARGGAVLAARHAVDRAKKKPTHCAVVTATDVDRDGYVEPVLALLLAQRQRRTPEGWEVYDLSRQNLTQREMAERLKISEQAVSARVRAAELRLEDDAVPALEWLFARADSRSTAP